MNPFIVAEIGANHGGSLDRAIAIVESAADAGADAVKLQTWTRGTMVVDRTLVVESGPWAGRNMYDLYEEAHTPWAWHTKLQDHAHRRGIELFSTAFDRGAVEFLESIGVKRHKIASFELIDTELVSCVAKTGKPIILSTGMASLKEIRDAVHVARKSGAMDITVLHCVSGYPTPVDEADLATIEFLHGYFSSLVRIGLSDHSVGSTVAIAATALGACVIEKHMEIGDVQTLDSDFSVTPDEFAFMVEGCRSAAKAVGRVRTLSTRTSEEHHRSLRRSLWWAKSASSGETVTREHLVTARPASGMPISMIDDIIGRKLRFDVQENLPVLERQLLCSAPG